MAIGNNSNKKKKIIVRTKPDPYLRKEWFTVKAPVMFKNNEIGQTPVLKTAGLRVSSEVIKGRVYECNLGDLADNEAVNGNIKFYFKSVNTEKNISQTDFFGYSITQHKYGSLFRKNCSKIETVVDATTKDGYQLRIFGIGFTERSEKQRKLNCYAKTSQIQKIRKAMTTKIQESVRNVDMKAVMSKLASQTIDESMTTAAGKIVPVRDVIVRRVKVISAPKYDAERIGAFYTGAASDFGKKVAEKKE